MYYNHIIDKYNHSNNNVIKNYMTDMQKYMAIVLICKDDNHNTDNDKIYTMTDILSYRFVIH